MRINLAAGKIRIRPLETEDWKSVLAIYLQGIATGQATFETTAPSWEKWDAGHLSFARLAAVSEDDGRLAGWAALSPVSSRPVYSGVAEVSVYVADDFRARGVGGALLDCLIKTSEDNGIWTLQASVFPENVRSMALHEKRGFREIGVRERIAKLNGVWRDTVLLERRSKIIGVE
ncbi:MAG: N-acetyltransferase family protein [Acidobacteriota bacterium]